MCKYIHPITYKQCPHENEPGDDYCIFHTRKGKKSIIEKDDGTLEIVGDNDEDIKSRFFVTFQQYLERLIVSPCKSEIRVLECAGFIFPELRAIEWNDLFNPVRNNKLIDFRHYKISVDFTATQFMGPVNFSDARFGGTSILNFGWDDIESPNFVCFNQAIFANVANFTKAEFHLSEDNISNDEIIDFSNSIFMSKVTFHKAHFNCKTEFKECNFYKSTHFMFAIFGSTVLFENCTFNAEADFSNTEFMGLVNYNNNDFHNKSSFIKSKFQGWALFNENTFNFVEFNKAQFFDYASFATSTVKGPCKFHGVEFNGDSEFRDNLFKGKAEFTGAKFNGKAWFNDIKFIKDVSFHKAESKEYIGFKTIYFCGDADFSLTRIDNEIDFRNSNCLKSVKFYQSKVAADCVIYASFFRIFNLEDSRIKSIFKIKNSFFGSLSFKDSFLVGSTIFFVSGNQYSVYARMRTIKKLIHDPEVVERCDTFINLYKDSHHIEYCDLENTIASGDFRIDFNYLNPANRKHPIISKHSAAIKKKDIPKEERKENWDKARKQYAWLKEQYRKQGASAYDDEDEAHWWAMECKYRSELLSDKWYKKLLTYFIGFFIKTIGGYGVKRINIITWIVGVILSFSVYYYVFYDLLNIKHEPISTCGFFNRILNSLYFSIITYATVGYGDISPQEGAAVMAMIEGVLGVFLSAAFVVILLRKIVR